MVHQSTLTEHVWSNTLCSPPPVYGGVLSANALVLERISCLTCQALDLTVVLPVQIEPKPLPYVGTCRLVTSSVFKPLQCNVFSFGLGNSREKKTLRNPLVNSCRTRQPHVWDFTWQPCYPQCVTSKTGCLRASWPLVAQGWGEEEPCLP